MICVKLPETPFSSGSFQVTKEPESSYSDWPKKERSEAFFFLQKIASVWKKQNIADQYLVYGKESSSIKSFNWEIIPFCKSHSLIDRIWKQTTILWSISFGGSKLSEKEKVSQEKLMSLIPSAPFEEIQKAESGNDPFCNLKVIERQRVLEGKLVNVLYSYAPIGFGGERLHFLVIPKEHKETFKEVSQKEYLEATSLSQKLIAHFAKTRNIQDTHLLHKTGVDSGQTISHWHLHVILTTNQSQDFFGRFTILKNMLIGTSPLSPKELEKKVQSFKEELSYLKPGKIS